MDIYVYRYTNKLWNFVPKWLFRLFHKPQVFKNCSPSAIQLDDSIPANTILKITMLFDETDDIKTERKNNGRTES